MAQQSRSISDWPIRSSTRQPSAERRWTSTRRTGGDDRALDSRRVSERADSQDPGTTPVERIVDRAGTGERDRWQLLEPLLLRGRLEPTTRFADFCLFIAFTGFWEPAMVTVYLVGVSVVIAALIGIASTAHGQQITTAGQPARLDIRAAGERSIRVTLKPLSFAQDHPWSPAIAERSSGRPPA